MKSPCLDCGALADGSRCPECSERFATVSAPSLPHWKQSRPGKSASARGYDHNWRKLSERARRLQPFCTDCGDTDDLQADHSPEAWRRKELGKPIRLQDIDVVCALCNVRRGAARPGASGARLPSPDGLKA